MVSEIGGFQKVSLVPAYGTREQELSAGKCHKFRNSNFIAQHHVRYSDYTHSLISRFDLTPVVLVRDIFDTVVSLRDHIRKESPVWPMASVTEEHANLPDSDLERLIVDLLVPWYVNFYVGWAMSPVNYLLVRYEDVVNNPSGSIEEILRASGYYPRRQEVPRALEKVKSGGLSHRFNVGKTGRGTDLNSGAVEHVKRLTSYYPSIDFSPMGV